MINVRNFNENPAISEVRYKLGKALIGKLYYKKNDEFVLLEDKMLNKIEELDPNVYYGLYIKYTPSKDMLEKNIYSDIYFDDNHLNIYNYISLIIINRFKNRNIEHINFIHNEIFEYLNYREHVSRLIEYYLEMRRNIDFVKDKNNILTHFDNKN